MRISDWSSDVCSSDLLRTPGAVLVPRGQAPAPTSAGVTRYWVRSGACITSRKWSMLHGHAAGMPRSSRYQLRHPVTHTGPFVASTRAASKASAASAVGSNEVGRAWGRERVVQVVKYYGVA